MPSHTPAERALGRTGTFRTPAGQRGREQEPSFRELEASNPFTALEETLAGRTERQQDLRRGEFDVQAADPAFEERLARIESEGGVREAQEFARGQIGAAQARPGPREPQFPPGVTSSALRAQTELNPVTGAPAQRDPGTQRVILNALFQGGIISEEDMEAALLELRQQEAEVGGF